MKMMKNIPILLFALLVLAGGRVQAQLPPPPPVFSQTCFNEYFTSITAASTYLPASFPGINLTATTCSGSYHDMVSSMGLMMFIGDTVVLNISRHTTNYTAYLSVFVDWDIC